MTAHGFVLAGGLSRRMGADKAAITRAGRALVANAVDALASCERVTVIHRSPDSIRSLLDSSAVDIVTDDDGGQGPLDGLRTALRRSEGDLTVVLAVDLVDVDSVVVDGLVAALAEDDVVAVARGRESRRHALVSVWRTTTARPIVDRAYESGQRSVIGLLDATRTRWVDVDDSILRNVNTPADLLEE